MPRVVCESPFWLLAKGRSEDAVKFFKRAAKFNRVPVPDDLVIINNPSNNSNNNDEDEKVTQA